MTYPDGYPTSPEGEARAKHFPILNAADFQAIDRDLLTQVWLEAMAAFCFQWMLDKAYGRTRSNARELELFCEPTTVHTYRGK